MAVTYNDSVNELYSIQTSVDLNGVKIDTTNTYLANIDLKTPASLTLAPVSDSGQAGIPVRIISQLTPALTDTQLRAAPLTVNVSNFPASQAVTLVSLPLPTGASTETTLAALSAKVPALLSAAPGSDTGQSAIPVRVISQLGAGGGTGGGLTDTQLRASPVPVSGTFWQATQPVSGSLSISNFPATQAISASALPLPSGAATSAKQPALGVAGTASVDVLTVQGIASMTPLKVDSSGFTQPVSGSLSISNFPASQAVTGTFWQATQPVSLATAPTTPITNANLDVALSTRLKPADTLAGVTTVAAVTAITNALPAGSNVIGKVSIDQTTPGTTNLVQVGGSLPTGANTIGAVTNTNLDVALSTRLKPADTLAGITTVGAVTAITNPLPAGTNKLGTVDIATAPATAKGTQGANAVPTQDLKDAGRNQTHYFMALPIVTTATDALVSLTGYKAGAAVAATTTPAVVTTGKTYRIQTIAITYVAIATAGTVKVTLRANTGGVVAITSPAVCSWVVGAPAVAAGVAQTVDIVVPDGLEFAAGTGIGISILGLGATQAAAAVGYGQVAIKGYEY